jgi:hypothetical protein
MNDIMSFPVSNSYLCGKDKGRFKKKQKNNLVELADLN